MSSINIWKILSWWILVIKHLWFWTRNVEKSGLSSGDSNRCFGFVALVSIFGESCCYTCAKLCRHNNKVITSGHQPESYLTNSLVESSRLPNENVTAGNCTCLSVHWKLPNLKSNYCQRRLIKMFWFSFSKVFNQSIEYIEVKAEWTVRLVSLVSVGKSDDRLAYKK